MKSAIAYAFETSPKVRHKNLRALVETDSLAFESRLVLEAGEVIHYYIDERGC